MKRILLTMFICGIVSAADSIPKHPRDLRFPARNFSAPRAADFRHPLSNGATVFAVEDHEFPLVHVSVLIRTGAYLEPAGKTGLAQIAGSQMRSGGTASRQPDVFDEETAFLAAVISSRIGDFSGDAGLNCLSKDIDAGLALFIDMLRNPAYSEGRLKLAKNQMLQSMERRNDSTTSIEQREFQRLLRGSSHFSTLPVTAQSLEAISRQDLIEFHSRYYFPANFTIAISGDFDTKGMLEKLEKAMSGWPNANTTIPPVPKPVFTPAPGLYLVNKKDVNQGRVRLGHLGVTISNPDHLPLMVMNGILGGDQFTSRIVARVRTEEGLAYSAGSSFLAGTYYEGIFQVGFQSKSPSVAQAIAIVVEELARMRETQVSAEELSTAVNKAIEAMPLRFSSASQRASQFANDFYTGLPEDYWQTYRQRLSSVTAAEIQRVARKYLQPDKLMILAVGDVETVSRGNPDKPQYSLTKVAAGREIVRIPLPDPLTMIYPTEQKP